MNFFHPGNNVSIFFCQNLPKLLHFFWREKNAAESRDQHSLIDKFAIFLFFAKKIEEDLGAEIFLCYNFLKTQFFESGVERMPLIVECSDLFRWRDLLTNG